MSLIVDEEIGRVPGSPDLKTETAYTKNRYGIRIPYPRVYTRAVTHVFTVSVAVPESEDFGSAIRDSVNAGLGAGAVAAFVTSPATAIPAFKAAFWAALLATVGKRIGEFEWIGIKEEQERGEWKSV